MIHRSVAAPLAGRVQRYNASSGLALRGRGKPAGTRAREALVAVTLFATKCRDCGGSGRITLLTSDRPCVCQREPNLAAALEEKGGWLSPRSKALLRRLGIVTVGQLLRTPRDQFLGLPTSSPTTVEHLAEMIRLLGGPADW